jgi:hypothetical protein
LGDEERTEGGLVTHNPTPIAGIGENDEESREARVARLKAQVALKRAREVDDAYIHALE